MIQQSSPEGRSIDQVLIDLTADMTEDAQFGFRRMVVTGEAV